MPYKDPQLKRTQSMRWYWKNRAKILALRKQHNINPDLAAARRERKRVVQRSAEYKAKVRAYRRAHPEVGRRGTRKWEQLHREQRKAIVENWYRRNREKVLARRKQYYLENKHRLKQAQPEARRRHALAVYGMTTEEYEAMLAKQGGRCAICGGDKPFGRNFHVDHCHSSNRVRGILCKRCNNGLGFFDDNMGRMRSAIRYLAKGVRDAHD